MAEERDPSAEQRAAIAAVRAAFQQFNDGYARRDLQSLDSFMADLFPQDDVQMIVGTGDDEWFFGLAGSRELVGSDWEFWGDVAFDVPGATISVAGDVAWLAARGTVSRTIPADSFQEGTLTYIKDLIAEGKGSTKEQMLEVFRAASNTIYETARGDRYVWPVRLTAVLTRSEGRWRFRQLHFSHATLRSPDERIVE